MNVRLVTAAVLLAALVACSPQPPPQSVGAEMTPFETEPGPGSTPTPPANPPLEEATPPPAFPTPEPVATALRFLLPTPGAQPVSAWRPPLYEVPFALSPYDHFYFTRPIAADQVNWPLPSYRYGGVFFRPEVVHSGIDIPAEAGSPVLAAGDGTVVWAGWGLFYGVPDKRDDPYGLAVAIRHDFGRDGLPLYTVYAHMQQVDVVVGQRVKTGERLGLVGQTGFTTGVHLHFEVRWGENDFAHTYNPELWLVPPQGWGVLAGRLTVTSSEDALLSSLPVQVQEVSTGRWRTVRTYGSGSINADPYYRENMVLSDLPAGTYRVQVEYLGTLMETQVEVLPGRVTYFTFQGYRGFRFDPPPAPTLPGP